MAGLIVLIVIAAVLLITLAQSIRIVPQARAGIVERLGRYHRTLDAGLALVVPYVDRVKPLIDLREQVVSFPPQPVITEDNLVVNIDTVIYFQVTDPKAATYEIADYILAIEQLTVTTLRNVAGGMTLEDTLTSRDKISAALRMVLDEATGKWGIRVNRVELKAVDPPGVDPGGDGEADARRARPPRGDPHRRGRQAVADPHGRGREAVRDPPGRGPARGPDPRRPRASPRRSRPSSTRSTAATPTPSCSPTSTSRCCRRSPRASRTSSGSSRARSRRRSSAWAVLRIQVDPHREHVAVHHPHDGGVELVRHLPLTLPRIVVGQQVGGAGRASAGRLSPARVGWPRCCGHSSPCLPCSATIQSVSPTSDLPTGLRRGRPDLRPVVSRITTPTGSPTRWASFARGLIAYLARALVTQPACVAMRRDPLVHASLGSCSTRSPSASRPPSAMFARAAR